MSRVQKCKPVPRSAHPRDAAPDVILHKDRPRPQPFRASFAPDRYGLTIEDRLAENPREVFLIEGHTDAVGNDAFNLALSDRRAETVALALTENFNIPPENLVVQGYGERYLKVPTQDAERTNRRATVRNITPLLQVAAAN